MKKYLKINIIIIILLNINIKIFKMIDEEPNEFLLEGLPKEQQNNQIDEEENEFDGMFIHQNDALQRSMMTGKRKTIMIPKSRLNIEDKANPSKKKLEQTEVENDFEVIDENTFNFLNREHETRDFSRYLNVDQILQLEDPFMRASTRPSKINNYRISAYNQRVKTQMNKKNYLFKEKPKNFNRNKSFNETENKTDNFKNEKTEEKMSNSQIFEKPEKFDSKNNENLSEEEEEEKEETPGNTFIKVSRTSFLSRDSIDLEDTTFEIEVVDSVAMTVLQVINCMIKANLVQIAISMKELGLIWGPITICLIALMSLGSLILILEVNKMTGQRSYLIFSEMVFGHLGSVIILICQFMSAFGGCLSFIVIFNKVVPSLLSFSLSNNVFSDEKIFSSILGVILFFYCYKQDVNIIKSAAKYAVFAVLLFFLVTILDFIFAVFSQNRLINLNSQWNEEKRDEILYGLNRSNYSFKERVKNIITAVACIILSYSFHIFTFSIYGCMGKISRKQFFITTSVSVLITTIIYLICGTIGYLLYYDDLNDSILDAVSETWLSSLLSLANVINVIMTFPITFAAVKSYFLLFMGIMITLIRDFFLWGFSFLPRIKNMRDRISNAIIDLDNQKDNKGLLMSGKALVKIPKFVELLLTLLIYCLVFLFASMYTKLKIIFSFTGGVMGNILSFIFPSIFYLGIAKKKAFSKYGILAVFFIIFGLVTMGICVTSTIQSIK